MKKVVSFSYSKCPLCGGDMYLLESSYNAYSLEPNNGNFVNKKVKEDNLTEFVCINCGYHVLANHSIYGILPKKSYKLYLHQKELDKGKGMAKDIGYIEED